MRTIVTLLAGVLCAPALAKPISIQRFETTDPDVWERIHRTDSDSLPLTLEELEKLAKAGVGEKTLMEMMRTRKVLALADADTLLRMKAAGATDAALSALSAYAVRPNDRFWLRVHLDLTSATGIGPAPYVYVEVRQPKAKRQEAFFYADVRGMIRKGVNARVVRDRSDPTLPETIASVEFTGPVKTRRHGPLEMRIAISQRPDLQSLEGVPGVKTFTLDYPAVSLDKRCDLKMQVARDPSIPDYYLMRRADLDCRWD